MATWNSYFRDGLMVSVALGAVAVADAAWAQTKTFDLPAQPAATGVAAFARQADVQVLISAADANGKRTNAIRGAHTIPAALDLLLAGTVLKATAAGPRTYSVVASSNDEQSKTEDRNSNSSQVDQVVVTGTRLRNLSETPSPLQTVTEREIELGGFGSIQDVVRSLPANQSLVTDETAGKTAALGSRNETVGTSINLRGLGSSATLVLLNGRRIAPAGYADAADVSMIPLAALSKIDVLTDTASAVYGTDAVSGVVNFILKKDFAGAESAFRYGTVTEGGENSYQASQLLGAAWIGGGAMAAYEFRHQNPLKVRDRNFTPPGAFFDIADLTPEQTQHSILLSANHSFNERIDVSSDVLWSKRDFYSRTAASTFGTISQGDVEQLQATASARYQSDALNVELNGTYSRSKNNQGLTYTLAGVAPYFAEASYKVWEANLILSGESSLLGTPGINYVVGASYRNEALLRLTPTSRPPRRSSDRNAYAVFAEGALPITFTSRSDGGEDLLLTGALRYERFSDFGSTTVYKVGALWKPTEELRIRASYGESFKAPNLLDLFGGENLAGLLAVNDPLSPTGRSNLFFFAGANPDLQPETATLLSAGFDFSPSFDPQLRLGGTYFDIDYDGKIQSPTQLITQALVQGGLFADVIDRTPDRAYLQAIVDQVLIFTNRLAPRGVEAADVFFDNRLQNLSKVRARGLDLYASYRADVASGDLSVSVNATYLFDLQQRVTRTAPIASLVDTTYNPADLKVRASAAWSRGSWTLSGAANYTDNYTNRLVTPAEKVDSYATVDARAEYRFERTGFGPVRVAVAVQNAFDTPPPFVRIPNEGYGYDPANATARGRFISLEVTKRW